MNEQKDYLSPSVEHRRILLEHTTAATSYSMSISSEGVQYEEYTAADSPYDATRDVLITY
jgi:hypothetical protein